MTTDLKTRIVEELGEEENKPNTIFELQAALPGETVTTLAEAIDELLEDGSLVAVMTDRGKAYALPPTPEEARVAVRRIPSGPDDIVGRLVEVVDEDHFENHIGPFKICDHFSRGAAEYCAMSLETAIKARLKEIKP